METAYDFTLSYLNMCILFQPMAGTAKIANDALRQAQEEAEVKVNMY